LVKKEEPMHADSENEQLALSPGPPAEIRMAELVMHLTEEVFRAKMETFLHFARDRSKIGVHLESSRDHGLRFTLSYPFARD